MKLLLIILAFFTFSSSYSQTIFKDTCFSYGCWKFEGSHDVYIGMVKCGINSKRTRIKAMRGIHIEVFVQGQSIGKPLRKNGHWAIKIGNPENIPLIVDINLEYKNRKEKYLLILNVGKYPGEKQFEN